MSIRCKSTSENVWNKRQGIVAIPTEYLSELSLLMKEYDNISLCGCFRECSNLGVLEFPRMKKEDSNLDMLTIFDTSNVTNMTGMFFMCSSLSALDLSTFNTSNVRGMNCMFFGCSSLSTLDLSTFNTSNVQSMNVVVLVQ